MEHTVFSFIPELHFQENKDLSKCRNFHDDCAVIDSEDSFRIIASRGMESEIGKSFFDAVKMKPPARDTMGRFLADSNGIMLLPTEKGSVLLFSAWYSTTSLLFAICLGVDAKEVRKILDFAQGHAIYARFGEEKTEKEKDSVERHLEEIFYYTSRIFSPKGEMWNHCLTVANFVGCRLEQLSMPLRLTHISEQNFHRLTALLVCALLELRHQYGKTRIRETLKDGQNVGKVQVDDSDEICITIEQLRQTSPIYTETSIHQKEETELFPFASLPAFRTFTFLKEGENLIFQATFQNENSIHAGYMGSEFEVFTFRIGLCSA